MLVAHKIIDALRSTDKKYVAPPLLGVTKEHQRQVADIIQIAEKFDFGDLMFEPTPDHTGWHLPALTSDEQSFWHEGLIPLPTKVCWYEFVIGTTRSGLLVVDEDPLWHIQRLDFDNGREVMFDGVIISMSRTTTVKNTPLTVELHGNTSLIDRLKMSPEKEYLLRDCLAVSGPLAVYLTLMLNSRSTSIVTEKAPAKLNAARLKRGHAPLPQHRIVTIVPKNYSHVKGADGVERRSPRLHWRRTHLRHLPTGRAIVIARMLVGKAELGEVSHEYRIGAVKE